MAEYTLFEQVAFDFIIFSTIIINLIEIVILMRNRKKLTNYEWLLLSLSVSDLLVGLSKGIVTNLIRSGKIDNVTDQNMSMLWFSVACSLSHTVAITLDRLFAVAYPMKHRVLSTRKHTMLLLISAWSFGLIVFPIAFTSGHGKVKLCLGILIIITSAVILMTYSFIIHKAVIKRRKFLSTSTGHSSEQSIKMKREFNLVCMCFVISLTFIAMTLPFSISSIISGEPPMALKFPLLANSMTNPLMYFFWRYIDRRIKKRKPTSSQKSQTTTRNGTTSTYQPFTTKSIQVKSSQI